MYKLIVICMYCGKHLRTHDVEREKEAGTSHGVCDKCFREVSKEIERMKNEWI